MSFTKGFWVTIIILTLNRLQDTQRTPWAGSRAERGDEPPAADASPITFLSNMSLSFRPRLPDQTQQENAWAFWTAEYKNASWSCHKALGSLWMPRESGEMRERLRRALTPALPFIRPQPPQSQLSPRLPRRQKLKTRFHWSTAWISWIPLLPTFSAFPGVNTVKAGRKGMGRAIGRAAILCAPSGHASPKTDWGLLQWGCNTDYS